MSYASSSHAGAAEILIADAPREGNEDSKGYVPGDKSPAGECVQSQRCCANDGRIGWFHRGDIEGLRALGQK
jgi:hypothetical protein